MRSTNPQQQVIALPQDNRDTAFPPIEAVQPPTRCHRNCAECAARSDKKAPR